MAYSFNGTNAEITAASAPVTNFPCTMSIWFNRSSSSPGNGTLFALRDAAADYMGMQNEEFAANTSRVRAMETPGPVNAYSNPNDWADDAWHHGCTIFSAVNARYAFCDGTDKGTGANVTAAHAFTRMAIGNLPGGVQWYLGFLAEAAMWNRALSDTEVYSLSRGYSPLFIPNGLKFYAPLVRNVIDLISARSLTNSNATVTSHPRIIYPYKFNFAFSPTVPSGSRTHRFINQFVGSMNDFEHAMVG